MTLGDLKTGMTVTLRNGIGYFVMRDTYLDGEEMHNILWRSGGFWMPLCMYNEDMTYKGLNGEAKENEFDIMEVFAATSPSFIYHPFGTANMTLYSRRLDV